MTATQYTCLANDSSECVDLNQSNGVLTINSTVVTNGIEVVDAFGGKLGTLRLMFTNTAGSTKTVTLTTGGNTTGKTGFATSGPDQVYTIPAGTAPYIINVNKNESSVRNQDDSLNITMATGLTGSFSAWYESSRLAVGS